MIRQPCYFVKEERQRDYGRLSQLHALPASEYTHYERIYGYPPAPQPQADLQKATLDMADLSGALLHEANLTAVVTKPERDNQVGDPQDLR